MAAIDSNVYIIKVDNIVSEYKETVQYIEINSRK